MMLRVYDPNMARAGRIEPGRARIDSTGNLRVPVEDCRAIGITEGAAVLMDHDGGLLGLRAPRGAEHVVRAQKSSGRDGASFCFYVAGPLRVMKLKARRVAGDYDLVRRDNALFVRLRPAEPASRAAAG